MATYEQIKKNGKLTDRYRVRYRDAKDEDPKSIACPDERTARALAGKIEAFQCMNPGVPYPRDGAPRAVIVNLDDVIVAWLRDLSRTRSASTVRIYGQAARSYLKHVGATATIDRLTSTTIGAWDASRVEQGIGENTREGNLVAVCAMWQWAWEHRADVAMGAAEPVRVARPGRTDRPACAPSWAEAAACIAMIDPACIGYRRAICAYYTGLRTFQITGMTYLDRLHLGGAIIQKGCRMATGEVCVIVELPAGKMTVIKGKTKAETAMRRCLPIAPPLLALLREWHAEDPSPRVCFGNEQHAVATITTAWKMAAAAGKARPEVFGPSVLTGKEALTPNHAFRRGFVTNLKRAGADTEAVEYMVGHAMPGVRGAYLDTVALSLKETVAKIPPLPERVETVSNVLPYAAAAAK